MKVLIGFVTLSDPYSNRGWGNILTAAVARKPQRIILLYTPLTEPPAITPSRYEKTLEELNNHPELRNKCDPEKNIMLDIATVVSYEKLKIQVVDALKSIAADFPRTGVEFELVSGLPRVRMLFELCLGAGVLHGKLLEAKNPKPQTIPEFPSSCPRLLNENEACERVDVVDEGIFLFFGQVKDSQTRQISSHARLTLNLADRSAFIDWNDLNLKPYKEHDNTFNLLLFLAAKRLYGRETPWLSKSQIRSLVYPFGMTIENAKINIPRNIRTINARTEKLTKKSGQGVIKKLIKSDEANEDPKFELNDQLTPARTQINISPLDLSITDYFLTNPNERTAAIHPNFKKYHANITRNMLMRLFPDLSLL